MFYESYIRKWLMNLLKIIVIMCKCDHDWYYTQLCNKDVSQSILMFDEWFKWVKCRGLTSVYLPVLFPLSPFLKGQPIQPMCKVFDGSDVVVGLPFYCVFVKLDLFWFFSNDFHGCQCAWFAVEFNRLFAVYAFELQMVKFEIFSHPIRYCPRL